MSNKLCTVHLGKEKIKNAYFQFKRPIYDAQLEWIGINTISQKQYIRFNSIPGLDGTSIKTTDNIKLRLRSMFPKSQSGRNFIATLGWDSYFHYTEIKDSQIGGYTYNKPVAFFEYYDGSPIDIVMTVSNGAFDVAFNIAGELKTLHYNENAKEVCPLVVGALLGKNLNYNAAKQKLIEMQIEVNGIVTFDGIPVRFKNQNNVSEGALYDKVTGQLFKNTGTGSFEIGPDIILPYDAEVQWLESTGTQWIDTGIYGNKNTVAKVIATSTITSGYSWILGSRQAWNIRNFSFYNGADQQYRYTFGFGGYSSSQNLISNVSSTTGLFHTFTIGTTTSIDEEWTKTYTTADFTTPNTMVMFGCNLYGTITKGYAKIQSCTIWQNMIRIRDFIPIRFINELNKVEGALYDKVSGQLFRNKGTGSFKIGNDKI